MATPRKHWFRLADSVLRWDCTPEQALTAIRLMAWLNTRRAREKLEPDEACRASINDLDCMLIAGVQRGYAARTRLVQLGSTGCWDGLQVRYNGRTVEVEWPNLAEFQGWTTRTSGSSGPESRPRVAPSDSDLRSPSPLPNQDPPNPPQAGGSSRGAGGRAQRAWDLMADELEARGKRRPKQTPARMKQLAARVSDNDGKPDTGRRLVLGYCAFHAGRRSDDFDPRAHFNVDTLLRAAHAGKYLDALAEWPSSKPIPLPGEGRPVNGTGHRDRGKLASFNPEPQTRAERLTYEHRVGHRAHKLGNVPGCPECNPNPNEVTP